MKKIKFVSLKHVFKDGIKVDSMISLGNPFEFPALIKNLGNYLIASVFINGVKFANRFRQLHNFHKYILLISKRHGPVYAVNYLKVCQLAVQKCIAKDEISSLRELNPTFPFPRLSRSKLPKIISLSDRRAIISGSPSIIRW